MKESKFALIIDADNIAAKYADILFETIRDWGNICVKRIYGDFTKSHNQKWRKACIDYCIDSRQIWIDDKSEKDTTDMAMVTDVCFNIEARFTDITDYIIVSGDGDFRILISSLKEKGKRITGISGNHKSTSPRLLNICDRFIYLDDRLPDVKPRPVKPKEKYQCITRQQSEILTFEFKVRNYIITYLEKKDDYIMLGRLKEQVIRRFCDFNESVFGYKKFRLFLETFDNMLFDKRDSDIYVKICTTN